MSLLWRLLQQIASWLDEWPQVRVERVPPAAKREQIKGQRNPLELEVRFLSTRPLFRQCFSGCIRQSAQDLDPGLIPGGLLPSELSSQSTLGLQRIIALGTSVFYMLHESMILTDAEQAVTTANGDRWKKWIRNMEAESGDHTETRPCRCSHFNDAKPDRIWQNGWLAWHEWVMWCPEIPNTLDPFHTCTEAYIDMCLTCFLQ